MKVRVGKMYKYNPVWIDRFDPAIPGMLNSGYIVKVVNKFGCPKANTMNHCYVEKNGIFAGMVCCNSLEQVD
jgi:hypothetical protein